MSRVPFKPEDLNKPIADLQAIMDGCTSEEHPTYLGAKEHRDRLIRCQELMTEGMEYWPAYVKARKEQGYDH